MSKKNKLNLIIWLLSSFFVIALIDPVVDSFLTNDSFSINEWISKKNLIGAFFAAIIFILLYNLFPKKK